MSPWFCVVGLLASFVFLVTALARREQRSGYGEIWGYDMGKPPRLRWRTDLAPYISCYGLYGILLVQCYYVGFVLWPDTAKHLLAVLIVGREWGSDWTRLLYVVSILGVGLGLAVLCLSAESYLRQGVVHRRLLRRFAHVSGPVVLLGALFLFLKAWAISTL